MLYHNDDSVHSKIMIPLSYVKVIKFDERLANNFRYLCKRKGISLREFCRQSNIMSVPMLMSLLGGRSDGLSIEKLIEIANFFEVNPEQIVGGAIVYDSSDLLQ